jgi:hypothetical protein
MGGAHHPRPYRNWRPYLSGVERSERNVSIDNMARITKGYRRTVPRAYARPC